MSHLWRERLASLLDGPDSPSMKAVSLKAGLGAGAVFDILRRGASPSIDNFIAICRALGVSPAAILDPSVHGVSVERVVRFPPSTQEQDA